MMSTTEIIVVAMAIILVIVVIAAYAKKKKLKEGRSNFPQVVSRDESMQSTVLPQREGRQQGLPENSTLEKVDLYSSLLYYVSLDGNTFGPFSLEQLKTYPLLEDTLITTNTLNGTWYEAKYFECLDDLFRPNLPYRIDADGVIVMERERDL